MAKHGTTREDVLSDPARLRRLLAELRDRTTTRAALAKRFGITRQALQQIAEAHGIDTPTPATSVARQMKVARL